MRKITENAAKAFINDKAFKSSNTEVKIENNKTNLYLHGHLIASKQGNKMQITNCGYFTNVTKERLNGLPNVSISQKKGKWYLFDKTGIGREWNGKTTEIKLDY